jgi:hypothetical protein
MRGIWDLVNLVSFDDNNQMVTLTMMTITKWQHYTGKGGGDNGFWNFFK